ncbi:MULTISPECIES: hypothetical protein [Streptomyces]|uniref:hypothetical protein n=1 Tax=Streptomyces TaxID=1883 RepID=UPI00163B8436|nr:hypothetical protein [Streptomyces sp. WAC05950]
MSDSSVNVSMPAPSDLRSISGTRGSTTSSTSTRHVSPSPKLPSLTSSSASVT